VPPGWLVLACGHQRQKDDRDGLAAGASRRLLGGGCADGRPAAPPLPGPGRLEGRGGL